MRAIRVSAGVASRFPSAFAYLLCALDFHLADVREVALAGERIDAFASAVRSRFRPHVVVAASGPLLAGRGPGAYVCRRFACEAPVTTPRPSSACSAPRANLEQEVAVKLPAGDLDAVLVPFAALDLDVAVEGVLAERAQHEL